MKILKLILILSFLSIPILTSNISGIKAEEILQEESMSPADIQLSEEWYFAEGNTMTAGVKNFTTFLIVSNSNSTAATLTVTYMYNGGGTLVKTHTAPANSKYSINTKNDVGLNKSFSMKIKSTKLVVAERAMYWDTEGESWTDGSTIVGMPSLMESAKWYFADGNTMVAGGKNFTTFFLIQNPSSASITAKVTYAFATGSNVVKTHTIPANSKYSINAKNDVGLDKSFSTMITTTDNTMIERSMYWNSNGKEWAGGDTILGVRSLARSALIPFNSTYSRQSDGRTTFLLVYNPTEYELNIAVNYYFSNSDPIYTVQYKVNPKSKITINPVTHLDSKSYAVKIHNQGGTVPDPNIPTMVVEKSLYLNGTSASEEWKGGYHQTAQFNSGFNTIDPLDGVYQLSTTNFAEFNTQSAGGRNFYNILAFFNYTDSINNPTHTNQKIFIYDSQGNVSEHVINIPPRTVKFIDMSTLAPNKIFSVVVKGSSAILIEKAIYWNSNGATTGLHGSNGYMNFRPE